MRTSRYPADDTDRTVRWTGRVIRLRDHQDDIDDDIARHELALGTEAYDHMYPGAG